MNLKLELKHELELELELENKLELELALALELSLNLALEIEQFLNGVKDLAWGGEDELVDIVFLCCPRGRGNRNAELLHKLLALVFTSF